MAKSKRPTWKDSDAPDAKGKMKNLSCSALASWMIKSRKGNVKKIVQLIDREKALNNIVKENEQLLLEQS